MTSPFNLGFNRRQENSSLIARLSATPVVCFTEWDICTQYTVTCIAPTLAREYVHRHLPFMVNIEGGRITTFSIKLSMSEAAVLHRTASFDVAGI
jgi:hypothetical protein